MSDIRILPFAVYGTGAYLVELDGQQIGRVQRRSVMGYRREYFWDAYALDTENDDGKRVPGVKVASRPTRRDAVALLVSHHEARPMPASRSEQPGEATEAAARPEMLDKDWTAEKGAAHAYELMAILARHDAGLTATAARNDQAPTPKETPVIDLNVPTTSPLIEARLEATEHARRARAYELAGDDDAAEHERDLAAWWEARVDGLAA